MSKKKVPHDEMLLAEAIAEAKARNLKSATGAPYRNAAGNGYCSPLQETTACCAVGGVAFLDPKLEKDEDAYLAAARVFNREGFRRWNTMNVYSGNDNETTWTPGRHDGGESFGWAFRNALDPEL